MFPSNVLFWLLTFCSLAICNVWWYDGFVPSICIECVCIYVGLSGGQYLRMAYSRFTFSKIVLQLCLCFCHAIFVILISELNVKLHGKHLNIEKNMLKFRVREKNKRMNMSKTYSIKRVENNEYRSEKVQERVHLGCFFPWKKMTTKNQLLWLFTKHFWYFVHLWPLRRLLKIYPHNFIRV